MATEFQHETAKLYEFPFRARTEDRTVGAGAEPGVQDTAVEFGSGWYHESAIDEAERARHAREASHVEDARRMDDGLLLFRRR